MTVPDFLVWHCVNCGVSAKGKTKPCGCATNVGGRDGPTGKREYTWWDGPEISKIKELENINSTLLAALRHAEQSLVAMKPEFSKVKDEGHAYHDQVLELVRRAIAENDRG